MDGMIDNLALFTRIPIYMAREVAIHIQTSHIMIIRIETMRPLTGIMVTGHNLFQGMIICLEGCPIIRGDSMYLLIKSATETVQ